MRFYDATTPSPEASPPSIEVRPVDCNKVAHFFVARVYDGKAVQLRIHLMDKESEDIAHSHPTAFFSYCLCGAYTHEIWRKELLDANYEGQMDPCSELIFETKRIKKEDPANTGDRKPVFLESFPRRGQFVLEKLGKNK